MADEVIVSFEIDEDMTEMVKQMTDEQAKVALTSVGVDAVKNAVIYATAEDVVDTGLLRNSLTFALGGESPKKRTYKGKRGKHSGRPGGSGSYSGTAESDSIGERKVYIGTNVEYAVYQEFGYHDRGGNWHEGRPFLRPAIENHREDYKALFMKVLSKLGN